MRYLFCSLSSFGFLCPAIGIAQILQRRGHEVAFVTDLSMAPLLDEVGMKRIPRGIQDGPSFVFKHLGTPLEAVRQIKHTLYAINVFSPDVLVGHQLIMSTIVVGKHCNLPVACIGLASYIWPTDVMSQPYMTPDYLDYVMDRYSGMLWNYIFCAETVSLPLSSPLTYNETPIIGDLFLLQSVPKLEGVTQNLPARVHFVGSCEWNSPRHDPELDHWLEHVAETRLPMLYLQLGTTFLAPDAWGSIVKVLEQLPVYVVASIGRMPLALDSIPDNFFARDHIAQGQVLPHAHAVISSSTTTAVLGALSHGLPLLLIPGDGGDQVDLMLRCMTTKVALVLPLQQITVENLTQKIQQLLDDDDLHTHVAQMRQALTNASGPAGAADLIEKLGMGAETSSTYA